ncbi:MAG: amidohydrolase [Eudoraea sp.]|nr:amidohydrolase [Eudoraea sp.]
MDLQLSVALIQTSLFWQDPAKNRAWFSEKIRTIEKGADLIVLPEMFTTGFTMTPEATDKAEGIKTLQWMKFEARTTNAAVIGSIPFYENEQYTNRLFFVEPNGNYHYYDKRHTFTLAGEHLTYASGKELLVVDYKGFKICPLICYDLRFPVWSRNTANYDILLYVANWPKPRITAWDTLLKARAIENMAYCIGVNRIGKDENNYEYVGHSACYDALGTQMAFSTKDEVLNMVIKKEDLITTRTKFRFLEDKDNFTLQ